MEDLARSIEIGSGWHLLLAFLGFFALIGGRYVIVAGLAYAACWRWFARPLAARRIQRGRSHATHIGHEIVYSLGSAALNALVATGLLVAERRGWTRLYWDIGERGLGYAIGCFFFLL